MDKFELYKQVMKNNFNVLDEVDDAELLKKISKMIMNKFYLHNLCYQKDWNELND